jgi:GNAT superfamily N-acetyltransferase
MDRCDMSAAQAVIRQAEARDFSAIADLINRSYVIERSHIEDEPETAMSIAAVIDAGGIYFVAVESDAIIACVNVVPRLRAVFKLTVEPARRRQGYGRKLMAEAESYGRRAGWASMRIAVLNFRLELFDYYRRLGYVPTGECRRVELGRSTRMIQPCHLIVMSKGLR